MIVMQMVQIKTVIIKLKAHKFFNASLEMGRSFN